MTKQVETVRDYLARGGQITRLETRAARGVPEVTYQRTATNRKRMELEPVAI